MKRRIVLTLGALLFLSGAIIFSYPHVQRFLYDRHSQIMISDFQSRVEIYQNESEDGTLGWLNELMVEYNERLYEDRQKNLTDPFSYEQVSFSLREFGFEEEMIGYIHIPRIGEKLPIFLGASQENMSRGAAHMTQTSLPVGGNNTNTVIAAHRGYLRARMFQNIHKLELGDEIFIVNFHQTLRYRVVEIKIILPSEIDEVLIQSGRDLVTLISCHPLRQNSQRYLVFAERVK